MAKIITKKSERIRKPFKEPEDQVGTNDIPDTQDTVEPTTTPTVSGSVATSQGHSTESYVWKLPAQTGQSCRLSKT